MVAAVDLLSVFFFFQAEDGIRDLTVTGVQTCALPIFVCCETGFPTTVNSNVMQTSIDIAWPASARRGRERKARRAAARGARTKRNRKQIGRASCRERV